MNRGSQRSLWFGRMTKLAVLALLPLDVFTTFSPTWDHNIETAAMVAVVAAISWEIGTYVRRR